MNWYEKIEQSNFRSDFKRIVLDCSKSLRAHPTFQRLMGSYGGAGGMIQYTSAYNISGDSQQVVSTLSHDDMEAVGITIANTLFLSLIEHNPRFAQQLIDDALNELHQHKATMYDKAALSVYGLDDCPENPEYGVDPASITVRPNNDDYEYWYDLNEDEDTIIVTCDLWDDDEHGDFIAEFQFDPEDGDEKQGALDDAEQLVRDLISGKKSLHSLIGDIPRDSVTQLTGSLTDMITSGLESTLSTTTSTSSTFATTARYDFSAGNPSDIIKMICP